MDDVLVGHISHREAFEKYVRRLRDAQFLDSINPHDHSNPKMQRAAIDWQGEWNAICETYANEFISFLVAGELEFFVVRPDSGEKVRVMPDDWRGDFWPSKPFMGEAIISASDSRLIRFRDRTPMVAKEQFEIWLNAKASGPVSQGVLGYKVRGKPSDGEMQKLSAAYKKRASGYPRNVHGPSLAEDQEFLGCGRKLAREIRANHAPDHWKTDNAPKQKRLNEIRQK